jgi:hypothetical protein
MERISRRKVRIVVPIDEPPICIRRIGMDEKITKDMLQDYIEQLAKELQQETLAHLQVSNSHRARAVSNIMAQVEEYVRQERFKEGQKK